MDSIRYTLSDKYSSDFARYASQDLLGVSALSQRHNVVNISPNTEYYTTLYDNKISFLSIIDCSQVMVLDIAHIFNDYPTFPKVTLDSSDISISWSSDAKYTCIIIHYGYIIIADNITGEVLLDSVIPDYYVSTFHATSLAAWSPKGLSHTTLMLVNAHTCNVSILSIDELLESPEKPALSSLLRPVASIGQSNSNDNKISGICHLEWLASELFIVGVYTKSSNSTRALQLMYGNLLTSTDASKKPLNMPSIALSSIEGVFKRISLPSEGSLPHNIFATYILSHTSKEFLVVAMKQSSNIFLHSISNHGDSMIPDGPMNSFQLPAPLTHASVIQPSSCSNKYKRSILPVVLENGSLLTLVVQLSYTFKLIDAASFLSTNLSLTKPSLPTPHLSGPLLAALKAAHPSPLGPLIDSLWSKLDFFRDINNRIKTRAETLFTHSVSIDNWTIDHEIKRLAIAAEMYRSSAVISSKLSAKELLLPAGVVYALSSYLGEKTSSARELSAMSTSQLSSQKRAQLLSYLSAFNSLDLYCLRERQKFLSTFHSWSERFPKYLHRNVTTDPADELFEDIVYDLSCLPTDSVRKCLQSPFKKNYAKRSTNKLSFRDFEDEDDNDDDEDSAANYSTYLKPAITYSPSRQASQRHSYWTRVANKVPARRNMNGSATKSASRQQNTLSRPRISLKDEEDELPALLPAKPIIYKRGIAIINDLNADELLKEQLNCLESKASLIRKELERSVQLSDDISRERDRRLSLLTKKYQNDVEALTKLLAKPVSKPPVNPKSAPSTVQSTPQLPTNPSTNPHPSPGSSGLSKRRSNIALDENENPAQERDLNEELSAEPRHHVKLTATPPRSRSDSVSELPLSGRSASSRSGSQGGSLSEPPKILLPSELFAQITPTAAPPTQNAPQPTPTQPTTQPTAQPTAQPTTRRSDSETVYAIYQKYNPNKVSEVGNLLEKYKGREEELVNKLIKKYGPAPANDQPPANSSTSNVTAPMNSSTSGTSVSQNSLPSFSGFNSQPSAQPSFNLPSSGISMGGFGSSSLFGQSSPPANVFSTPSRPVQTPSQPQHQSTGQAVSATEVPALARKIYLQCNPDKLTELPNLLSKYSGRELELLEKLEKKYGVRAIDFRQSNPTGNTNVFSQPVPQPMTSFQSVSNPSPLTFGQSSPSLFSPPATNVQQASPSQPGSSLFGGGGSAPRGAASLLNRPSNYGTSTPSFGNTSTSLFGRR